MSPLPVVPRGTLSAMASGRLAAMRPRWRAMLAPAASSAAGGWAGGVMAEANVRCEREPGNKNAATVRSRRGGMGPVVLSVVVEGDEPPEQSDLFPRGAILADDG